MSLVFALFTFSASGDIGVHGLETGRLPVARR
jgi:hypothetical protein